MKGVKIFTGDDTGILEREINEWMCGKSFKDWDTSVSQSQPDLQYGLIITIVISYAEDMQ